MAAFHLAEPDEITVTWLTFQYADNTDAEVLTYIPWHNHLAENNMGDAEQIHCLEIGSKVDQSSTAI